MFQDVQTVMHCKLNELLLVLPPRVQLATQQISVLQVEKKKKMLQKVELGSTLRNILLRLVTLKFVAWQVEHAVVIRATTRSTCNATMLRHKFNE